MGNSFRRLWLLVCAVGLILASTPYASAEMIKWIDANGTVHVAGSMGEIPPEFRAEAKPIASSGAEDDRVHIIPSEPDEVEEAGWFSWGAGEAAAATPSSASKSTSSAASSSSTNASKRIPEFGFGQALVLVIVQFFASILVLAACAVLIGERVEHLGGKAFGSIFAQRFLMFAAFLWISHTTTMNFVPQSASLGDLAQVLVTPILAELGIMTVVLRYTICEAFGRAAMLSVLFCTIDAMSQGLLLFGAIILIS